VAHLPERFHAVKVKAAEEKHLVAWLSKRLGHVVRSPGLTEAGCELVGERLLPAAQLMYEDGGGRRVTLYVRRGHPDTDSTFRLVSEDGVGEFY